MKQQVKKGVLEIFVLAILMRSDSYGYKIVSDLIQYIDITESTLYPILRRLEKADELKTYNVLFQGRNRKYYQITKTGKKMASLTLADSSRDLHSVTVFPTTFAKAYMKLEEGHVYKFSFGKTKDGTVILEDINA